MIRKEKLLLEIESLVDLKENLIPVLDKHLPASLSFSPFAKSVQEEAVEKLRYLTMMQNKHVNMLKDLKKQIEGSGANVY